MPCFSGILPHFLNSPPISLRGKYPSRRGEGGEAWLGKKDTGYLYKAFMVAQYASTEEKPINFCRGEGGGVGKGGPCSLRLA